MPAPFPNDASLVLIGMRCVGKSTLATIAARTLKWKLVDEKALFEKATGYSVAQYIARFGRREYSSHQVAVLKTILEENQRRCVIVCSSSCVQTQAGRDLLRHYLPSLPVVHVMRDANALHTLLETKWDGDVMKVIRDQEPVYLSCSNRTFFNTDDAGAEAGAVFDAVTPSGERPTYQFLSLKHVEYDFLRFLSSVYGPLEKNRPLPRSLHFSLQLPFQDFKKCGPQLERLSCCADVLLVQVALLIEEYLAMSAGGSQWWEYVVDQLSYLRRHTKQPIVYHTAAAPSPLALDYFDLIRLGLRLGVDFVTVDLSQEETGIESVVKEKGHTKIIGWLHDEDPISTGGWGGEARLAAYNKAVGIGCDVVQLTQPAITPSCNAAAQSFAHLMTSTNPVPLAAYNTGRLGRPSICFNKTLSPVSHPDISTNAETVSIPQIHAALFASFTFERLRFFVMGANVDYSVAPVLHNSAFDIYGIPHVYSILQTDTLSTLDALMHDQDVGGLGLSSPFKTTILPRLDSMSDEARTIGAVNTILPIRSRTTSVFSTDEQRNRAGPVLGLYGENTDWQGIRSCISRHLSPANAVGPFSTALVLGAGGMARAAVYALLRQGIRTILIYNRTYDHALNLVSHFEAIQIQPKRTKISALRSPHEPWPNGLHLPTVIVNCSPTPGDRIRTGPIEIGRPKLEPAVPVPPAWLQSPTGGVYLELAYNSTLPSSELLRICSRPGWIGVTGLEIFIETASAQFEFWTGRRAPTYVMRSSLAHYLGQLQDTT
ncbi:hypothetical protein BJY01DRAFT_252461 [Aspergillus pseudoustus]|uniref:Quinate repressor protein n=1 Tax=Aspergillus pseudoustus TaxID=1810923 RepID=A0ABR4J6I2_9EURO